MAPKKGTRRAAAAATEGDAPAVTVYRLTRDAARAGLTKAGLDPDNLNDATADGPGMAKAIYHARKWLKAEAQSETTIPLTDDEARELRDAGVKLSAIDD